MAECHMKRYSTSLITRELQIKTTVRYHLTAVRMAIIKKFTINEFWGEGSPPCWWECKLVQSLPRQYGGSLRN